MSERRTPSKRTTRRRRRNAEEERRRNAEHQRAWRDRQRGGPPHEPKACGTYASYRRHQREGEECDECRQAYNRYQSLGRRARLTIEALSRERDPDKRAALHDTLRQTEIELEEVR